MPRMLAITVYSWGATMGAISRRWSPAQSAGAGGWRVLATTSAQEVEQLHFAPRVTVPVLMLNGRTDFVFPLETSQLPMFNLLGTPSADKHHVIVESGHSVPARALSPIRFNGSIGISGQRANSVECRVRYWPVPTSTGFCRRGKGRVVFPR